MYNESIKDYYFAILSKISCWNNFNLIVLLNYAQYAITSISPVRVSFDEKWCNLKYQPIFFIFKMLRTIGIIC